MVTVVEAMILVCFFVAERQLRNLLQNIACIKFACMFYSSAPPVNAGRDIRLAPTVSGVGSCGLVKPGCTGGTGACKSQFMVSLFTNALFKLYFP